MKNHQNGPAARTLESLRNTLLSLHKTLLDSERSMYEHEVARIQSPGQFLGLLMNDPWFAYLRELSGLVVTIDELLDGEEPATAADADRLLKRASDMLRPVAEGQGFERRYYEAMQRDPDVVLAHAAATRALQALRA